MEEGIARRDSAGFEFVGSVHILADTSAYIIVRDVRVVSYLYFADALRDRRGSTFGSIAP